MMCACIIHLVSMGTQYKHLATKKFAIAKYKCVLMYIHKFDICVLQNNTKQCLHKGKHGMKKNFGTNKTY